MFPKGIPLLTLTILLAVVVTALPLPAAHSDSPYTIEWSRTFGGDGDDYGRSVWQTSDGGYIIAGNTYSFDSGRSDVYLVKTNSNGDLLWYRTFGGSSSDLGFSVRQTSDEEYIIAGYTLSFGVGQSDAYLVKTDSDGNELWSRTFGGSGSDYAYSVQQTTDGGYILAGEPTLIKTDSDGDLLWSKTYNGWGFSVQQTSDGGYIVAGGTKPEGTDRDDVYLVKTDSNGDLLWKKTFGGILTDYGRSVQQTSDGGYIIVGSTQSYGAGSYDIYLIKTDSDGNKLWSRTFGGSDSDYGYSVQQTKDGGYVIAGDTKSGNMEVYLIKTDSDGNELWSRTFGGSKGKSGFSVQQTSDGGYIVAGITYAPLDSNLEVYLIKVPHHEVLIDFSGVSASRCDVGSNQTVSLHASWSYPRDNGPDVTSGAIYVNGTGYTVNATGWISFQVSSSSVEKKTWTITGVNCSGITDYNQTATNPSIIWDQVQVQGYTVSDYTPNLGETVTVDVALVYDYNDSAVQDGSVGINTVEATNRGSGVWRINDSRDSIGPVTYDTVTVSGNTFKITKVDQNGQSAQVTWRVRAASMTDIEDRVFNATANTIHFVPTGNIYDDSAFYAFYALKDSPQIITPPTQSSASSAFLDVDGSPLFDGDIVTFGGRYANRLVAYYEDAGLAKIGFANNGTHRIFRRISDGAHVYAVDSSTYDETEKDYFIFQVYNDGDRYIFSEWGIQAEGTYAGGVCFIDIIYPDIRDYTDQNYIYSWADLNDDDMPQPEEMTLEATSSNEKAAWENPYEDWGKSGYSLLGGQGEHLHTLSFSKNPDANIEMETILDIFSQSNWSPTSWATRGVHVGGYENTNGGYEWIMVGAHNHRRTDNQYKKLLEFTEQNAPRYGYKAVIRASEVFPPHEGMIWNGLCRGGYETYPNAFTANSKTEFVSKVVSAENNQHHSIAVVLHPQAGGMSGRNNLSDALAMVQAGAELIEIFNGCWESGDDLCVNDHYRTGSTNMGPSPADGNTEDYLYYNVTGGTIVYTARADGNAENYWDHILSQGHRVWGCGSDDFHGRRLGIEPPYRSHNWGGNYVWMEILAPSNPGPEDLVRCLERGSFYVTQGVQIQSIEVTNDMIRIVGDSSVDFIEAIGSVGGPVALGELNQGDGDSGTLLKRSFGNVMEYTPDPNSPYDDLYVRFRLVNTDYDENYYYDEHGDGGGDVYAWTQPFYKKTSQTGGN